MFKRYRKAAGLGLFAVVVAGSIAIAAGNWSTLPIVGEASFCASNVSGVVLPTTQGPYGVVPGSTQGSGSGICGQTVPAGPADLTGAELVPADTGLLNGQPPATVTVPVPSLASGAYFYFSALTLQGAAEPSTGSTQTLPNLYTNILLDPTGTLANMTLTMPSSPLDGQIVRIASSATITALHLVGAAGQTVGNNPTALTLSTTGAFNYAFLYRAANTTWYRVQ